MNAGDLRHRVELQKQVPGPTRDEYGQPVVKWVTQATAWCAIDQLTGNSLLIAQQKNPQSTHEIRTRFMPSVPLTTTWRLKHNGRFLFIASINNPGDRKEEWILTVGELNDV